ncbi:MAG: extracellular solute-binding protein [Spirochaetia bacterium]|jgi:multiple sugar transport system substrate-binding protein
MKQSISRAFILATVLSLALAGVLVGCQRNASSGTAQNPSSVKGSVTYWYNQDWENANQQLFDAFAKAYPNITLNATGFTYDTFIEKIRAAYSAGEESDVQQVFGDWASDLMKHKRLAQVPKDYAEQLKKRLFETTLAGYTYEGVLYGVPKEYNIESGGVLYYPADLKKAGYDEFPTTFSGLMDAAKKLTRYDTKGNPIHWGFDFMTTDNIPYLLLSFILQQKGSYWAADKIHVTFTTPEAQKALQAMADMVLKDKVTEITHLNDTNNDASNYFFKGQSSMCFRGPWVIPVGKSEFQLDNFAYGSMPSFTGTSKAFAAESGWGEVVSARTKNADIAWTFVRFISSAESHRQWNTLTNTIPSEKSVAESPDFLKSNPMIKVSLDVLPYGQPIGPLQSIDTFKSQIVVNNFTSLCTGGQDVGTTLRKIEEETNKMIDDIRAQ